MAIPFATDAICFLFGAILVSRISSSTAPARTEAAAPGSRSTGLAAVWRDLVDGFRWLRGHPPMRTLALTVVAFNVTFGAAWSVLVLYAGDRLGMDSVGFGLLTTASAIGGIVGTALVRAARAAVQPRPDHARRPLDRDADPPDLRAHDLAGRRAR